MMSTLFTLAERRPSFSGMSAKQTWKQHPLPGQGWRCQCLACPPPSSCCHRKSRVLEAPRVAKLMGFMRKREKYEMEDAKKSSGGMVPIEASLLSSDAGPLLRLAASLLGHNLCFVTRNQIKLFVLLTKDLLVRIKSCREGIEGVVCGKLIA